MLGVDEQRARATHYEQAHIGADQHISQVDASVGDTGDGLGRPAAHGVHHGVESFEVFRRELECIFDDGVLSGGPILAAHDGHVESATHGLLNDEAAGPAVRCYNCDFLGHHTFLSTCGTRRRFPCGSYDTRQRYIMESRHIKVL